MGLPTITCRSAAAGAAAAGAAAALSRRLKKRAAKHVLPSLLPSPLPAAFSAACVRPYHRSSTQAPESLMHRVRSRAAAAGLALLMAAACGDSPGGPTPPPPPPPITTGTLVGAGDIAICGRSGPSSTADLLDLIDGTVFTAGDNAYFQGTAAQFAECYDPTWGRHKGRTRPSPGNHEYESPG